MSDWHHAPMHQLLDQGAYIVTAGTYQKRHHLHDAKRLDLVLSRLFECAEEFGWRLHALDDQPGRRIRFQYYDTHITYPASYYTRLKYVHQNPVHHGLVRHAGNWKWCSAGWFERRASSMFRRLLDGVQIDRVHVMDPFEPVAPGYDEDKAASSRRTPQVSPTS